MRRQLGVTLFCVLFFGACALDRDGRLLFDDDPGGGGSGGDTTTNVGGAGGVGGVGGGGPTCGDGVVDAGEECDGSEFGGQDCSDFGFSNTAGLTCSNCVVQTSGCMVSCDGVQLETGEVCDGALLNSQDCTNHGYTAAAGLACGAACDAYDTTGCATTCDGTLLEPGEPCDGTLLNAQDCTDHGYVLDTGLACEVGCADYDTSGCTAACDNGLAEPTEDCDDGDQDPYDGCHECRTVDGGCTLPYGISLVLGAATQVFTGTTVGAVNHAKATCGGATSGDHVFAVTPDADGFVTAWLNRPETLFDTVLYARDNCGVETDRLCADDTSAANNGGELVSFFVGAGKTAFIVVDGFSGAEGVYELHLDLSAGTCADPVPFPNWPSSPMCAHGGTINFSDERSSAGCGGTGAGDVVYRAIFHHTDPFEVRIIGANTNYDSVLTVDDDCGTNFHACDNQAVGVDEVVTWNSGAVGSDAFVWVDGFSGAEGRYEVCIDAQ